MTEREPVIRRERQITAIRNHFMLNQDRTGMEFETSFDALVAAGYPPNKQSDLIDHLRRFERYIRGRGPNDYIQEEVDRMFSDDPDLAVMSVEARLKLMNRELTLDEAKTYEPPEPRESLSKPSSQEIERVTREIAKAHIPNGD